MLVSGGRSNTPAVPAGASASGDRVWFTTSEALVGDDVDRSGDLYQRSGGVIRLLSPGSAAKPVAFSGASTDGGRVRFSTAEALLADDRDAVSDVYEASAVGLVLLTPGTAAAVSKLAGATPDGLRTWIVTPDALDPEDADTVDDVYERTPDGGLRLLAPPSPLPVSFALATPDGGTVVIETRSALVPEDTDGLLDAYTVRVAPPEVQVAAAVSGTPTVGSILTCEGAIAGESVVTSVLWTRDGSAEDGVADGTYRVSVADAGSALACLLVGTNGAGRAETLSPGVRVPPAVLEARMSGLPLVGSRLLCQAQIVGAVSSTVFWTVDGIAIPSVVTPAITIRPAFAGHRIACSIVADERRRPIERDVAIDVDPHSMRRAGRARAARLPCAAAPRACRLCDLVGRHRQDAPRQTGPRPARHPEAGFANAERNRRRTRRSTLVASRTGLGPAASERRAGAAAAFGVMRMRGPGLFVLDLERRPAAAPGDDVRVLDLEAGLVQ